MNLSRRAMLLFMLAAGAVFAPAQEPARVNLITAFAVLPPAGWTVAESLRIYRGQDLYQMVDGGADIYIEYGFTWAGARRFIAPGAGEISVEIYEMRDTAAAFGMFSFQSAETGTAAPFGQEGVRGDSFIMFRKERFVVSVTALDSTARPAVSLFARAVDGHIPAAGRRPDLAEALQRPNFHNTGVTVIRGPIGFENRAQLGGGDLFQARDGVSGRFGGCRTFILRYSGSNDRDAIATAAVRTLTSDRGYRQVAEKENARLLGNPKAGYIHMNGSGRFLLLTLGENRDEVQRVAFMLGKIDLRGR